MKRIAAVFLLLLLLTGCVGVPAQPETLPASSTPAGTQAQTAAPETAGSTEPVPLSSEPIEPASLSSETAGPESTPPTTEALPEDPALSGMEDLADSAQLLFFRQDQLGDEDEGLPRDHRGDLLSLEELHAWHEAQAQLPRTHYYDDSFADLPLLLEAMDYCLSEGYAGVTLPVELVELGALSEEQWLMLYWTYRIDDAPPYYSEYYDEAGRTAYNAVWFSYPQPDSVERFHAALEKAREIVADMPPELDEYDRAQYLYSWLKSNVKYDGLGLNYYNYEWYFLYDALLDGLCVCSGFSDALYYLYNLAGIDCVCLAGHVEASDLIEAQNHQWNAASLYGSYYCFDVTWDATALYNSANSFFAVSEEMLNGVSQRSYHPYLRDIFPACPAGFRPPEAWNETPEGALRSYLWLLEYCRGSMARSYLIQSDLLLWSEPPVRLLSGSYMLYDLDYEAFVDSFLPYVTRVCFLKNFENSCYRSEEGKLAVNVQAGNVPRYRIESVSGEGGRYSAQLVTEKGSRATASFTVEETNGRYTIKSVSIREA